MKKLKSLKLNVLSKKELERREMKMLKGTAGSCACVCAGSILPLASNPVGTSANTAY